MRPIERSEEARYRTQMAQHHYLGDRAKIGESIWYVATWREQWVAQINVSAAALKCGVRNRWIGWDFGTQYDRLRLIANNSRFLILPDWRRRNVGSRVLALSERRITHDWAESLGQQARERFGCRREHGRYVVPSEFVIRDCLVRMEPDALDRALNAWNQAWGKHDKALAMDGKTMKNAIDDAGRQAHIMSVIGPESNLCHLWSVDHTPKKWAPCP